MPSGKQSERLPTTGIVFRETTADYENSWHQLRGSKLATELSAAFIRTGLAGRSSPTYLTDRLGVNLDGMLAEYAVFNEEAVVTLPSHLSFEEAATLPCAAVTAWVALTRGRGLPLRCDYVDAVRRRMAPAGIDGGDEAVHKASRPKSSSQVTLCWRKRDSNIRSPGPGSIVVAG
jgi:hypothetical protein